MIELIAAVALKELLPFAAAFLALVGTVLVAYITMKGNRASAKDTVILTREHAADELIQAANAAMGRENERLYRVLDRRDAEVDRLERELEECRAAGG